MNICEKHCIASCQRTDPIQRSLCCGVSFAQSWQYIRGLCAPILSWLVWLSLLSAARRDLQLSSPSVHRSLNLHVHFSISWKDGNYVVLFCGTTLFIISCLPNIASLYLSPEEGSRTCSTYEKVLYNLIHSNIHNTHFKCFTLVVFRHFFHQFVICNICLGTLFSMSIANS